MLCKSIVTTHYMWKSFTESEMDISEVEEIVGY